MYGCQLIHLANYPLDGHHAPKNCKRQAYGERGGRRRSLSVPGWGREGTKAAAAPHPKMRGGRQLNGWGDGAAAAAAIKHTYGFPLIVLGKHTRTPTHTHAHREAHVRICTFLFTHTFTCSQTQHAHTHKHSTHAHTWTHGHAGSCGINAHFLQVLPSLEAGGWEFSLTAPNFNGKHCAQPFHISYFI